MKKQTNRIIWSALLAVAVFTGCKKEKNNGTGEYFGNGTFILCEGAFLQGNARIDFLNKNSDSLKTDIFRAANDIPLGDVLQSMTIFDEKAFVVVNNSGKIEVTNPKDMKIITTITGLTSPRYVCRASESKAYVSDLFGGKISIVNLNSLSVTGNIPLPGWTEEMWKNNSEIWVTNGSRDYVYILENDALKDSVMVGYGSTSLREDAQGNLWVLTGGNYLDNTPSKLVRINPENKTVDWEFPLPDFGASKLRMNATKTTLYFLYNGKVFRKNTGDTQAPAQFISLPGKYFYGIGIEPSTGNIWLGDAGDFTSAGTVMIFSPGGGLLKEFTTGVAPTDFVF
jgi:DNA-binding beta-propeller fold protein YncE